MGIVIRRLEEHDEVENFDCGDDALNNYLRRHAWTNQQKSSIGVSYVALDEDAPRTVLGYFTLAMASVPRDTFPKKYVRGLPPYDLPLILLARLAVDRRFRKRSASACEWPMKLAVAASSQTRTGIGSAGMHDTGLCPSRVLRRRGHKGCFWTCGRCGQRSSVECVERPPPRAVFNPPKTLH
jgi:hypothetical protein